MYQLTKSSTPLAFLNCLSSANWSRGSRVTRIILRFKKYLVDSIGFQPEPAWLSKIGLLANSLLNNLLWNFWAATIKLFCETSKRVLGAVLFILIRF